MRLWRYCVAGLLYDWLAFVFLTVVPIRAASFQASATELALLQTANSIVYVLNSLFIGRLSDRVSRALLARVGCLGAIAACVLTLHVTSLGWLYLAVPVMGLAGSIYWPNVQGALGAESDPSRMEKAIGWFNVSWSVGKTLGFALAGWLIDRHGFGPTLWIAAAAAVPILALYPGDSRVVREAGHEAAPSDRASFRTMSYVANFLAFGVGTTFSNQFFRYLERSGLGRMWERKTYFGIFLGTMFAAQTIAFVVLQRGRGWTYRRSFLYAAQFLAAAATIGVTLIPTDLGMLGAAAAVGLGLGFIYASSIYYSLHGPSDHGKYAGLHEAVLSAGTFLVPLAGGALADLTGDVRMPYWLAAAGTLVAVAAEEVVYRRRPSS